MIAIVNGAAHWKSGNQYERDVDKRRNVVWLCATPPSSSSVCPLPPVAVAIDGKSRRTVVIVSDRLVTAINTRRHNYSRTNESSEPENDDASAKIHQSTCVIMELFGIQLHRYIRCSKDLINPEREARGQSCNYWSLHKFSEMEFWSC